MSGDGGRFLNLLIYSIKDIIINKVNQTASKFYSDVKFSDSDESKIYCAKDGTEANDKKICVKSNRTDDVIGYLEADGFSIAPHVRNLTIACLYNGHGCYLTKNNHIETLPIWVAKHIPLDNWYETDIYATTSDGGDTYTKDRDFLKYCLIYTCLSNQNKCLSFKGSDGRIYQNELCFDTGALALNDLQSMTLNDDEKVLINLWEKILEEAKQANNYSSQWRYGVYQIIKELNTYTEIGTGKQKSKIYDYPELNGDLDTLRVKLKEYYKNYITPLMFKYELVK